MIRRVFLPRHVDKKGAVQPVAPQQLLWLWALWVQLWWVLVLLLRLQLLWPPGPDCRRLSSGLHHRRKWHLLGKQQNRGACLKHCSWPMVRLHLIGAEDVDPDGYPYEIVAQSWGTTAHRRRRSQNVRKPRKDKGKGQARERVLPETAEYVDNLGQVSDSGSSLSSFGSISTDASSSSALTVSDEESGTDSDSDSE